MHKMFLSTDSGEFKVPLMQRQRREVEIMTLGAKRAYPQGSNFIPLNTINLYFSGRESFVLSVSRSLTES